MHTNDISISSQELIVPEWFQWEILSANSAFFVNMINEGAFAGRVKATNISVVILSFISIWDYIRYKEEKEEEDEVDH